MDDGYANNDRWNDSAYLGICYGEVVGYYLEWNLYSKYTIYRNLCDRARMADLFQAD